MQVRRLVFHHEGEQFCEIHYNPPGCGAKVFSSLVQAIMATIAENLQAVRARIGRAAQAARRDGAAVTLLAVSKTHPASRISEARAAGQQAFGENYVQEAIEKMTAVPELEWHLIGPLQSNKTRVVAELFQWVQTLDREKIAKRLSEQRPGGLPALNVLIQVNASGEKTKSGVPLHEAHARGARVATAPDATTAKADVLVLAVKPQDARAALASVAASIAGKLVISIAAGVRLDALSRWLGGHRKLVRCMPNTPALVGAGITGVYALPEVDAEDRKRADTILGAVGLVVWVKEERLLDVVTAVSGSGPA